MHHTLLLPGVITACRPACTTPQHKVRSRMRITAHHHAKVGVSLLQSTCPSQGTSKHLGTGHHHASVPQSLSGDMHREETALARLPSPEAMPKETQNNGEAASLFPQFLQGAI